CRHCIAPNYLLPRQPRPRAHRGAITELEPAGWRATTRVGPRQTTRCATSRFNRPSTSDRPDTPSASTLRWSPGGRCRELAHLLAWCGCVVVAGEPRGLARS